MMHVGSRPAAQYVAFLWPQANNVSAELEDSLDDVHHGDAEV